MLRKFGKRAQTTAEYAILIALIVAAVTAMQIYVKRGIQSKVRDAVLGMGDTLTPELTGGQNTKQYEPYYLSSDATTTQYSGQDNQTFIDGGGVQRGSNSNVNVNRTVSSATPN